MPVSSSILAVFLLASNDVVSAFTSHGNFSFRARCGGPTITNRLSTQIDLSNVVSTAANSEQVFPISESSNANGRTKEKSRTQRIMEATSAKTDPTGQTLGAGGSSTYEAFLKAEDRWKSLKSSKSWKSTSIKGSEYPLLQSFVTDDGAKGSAKCWEKLRNTSASNIDFDVVVSGGTLGIFIALALQLKGYSVCVIEVGRLQGREQEWNISRKELDDLIREGLLTEEEVERIITTEFPGCRAGFKNEEGELVCHLSPYSTAYRRSSYVTRNSCVQMLFLQFKYQGDMQRTMWDTNALSLMF